jgi:DNA polymerase III delta subunit
MGGRRAESRDLTGPQLAYFWGEDAFSIELAAEDFAQQLSAQAGQRLDVWRAIAGGDDSAEQTAEAGGSAARRHKILAQIDERTSTGTLFGAGTVVIVRQPGPLIRESASREQLLKSIDAIAPGNAIVFVDLIASGGKGPAQAGALRDEISVRKGKVEEFPAPSRERMEAWITNRAKQLGATLGPGAARLLAERVGAFVRENDVDRRRQTEMANGELEKLALYRPDAPITPQDVDELVGEAVPGSTWAFLDAVGGRRPTEASVLISRLLAEATPMPVLITQIHRRLRELIVVREHVDAGTKPADIVRELKLQPFRAQKLTEQARTWSAAELDDALNDLYELDLLSKGIATDGSPHSLSEDRSELALVAWLGEHLDRN